MSTPNTPVLLLIHPEALVRHQLKQALGLGRRIHVMTSESSDDALNLLADGISGLAAVLLPLTLPNDGVRQFMDGLNILAPKPRPAIMVYAHEPSPHELADMKEGGVTTIIDAPPALPEVVRELVSLRQSGKSPGRTRMETGAAPRAAGEDPRASRDPGWRDRMIRLASVTRSRTADFHNKRLQALLAKLDEMAGGRLSLPYVEAMLLMSRNDARQAEVLIRSESLDRDLIDKLLTMVEERFQFPGGQAAPRAVIIHGLEDLLELARLRRRGDGWTPNYSDLKAGATDLMVGKLGLNTTAGKGYRDRLSAWLGVEAAFIDTVEPERLRRIAGRVVRDPDECDALDFARLSLLAFLLKQKRLQGASIDPTHLRALDGLLNGQGGDPSEAERLQSRVDDLAAAGVSPEDLPFFDEFASLFSVIEGSAGGVNFDTDALERIRQSVAKVSNRGKAPPPPRSPAASAGNPLPTPAPAPPSSQATAAGPAPAAAKPADSAPRLLPRLAADLGLSDGFFTNIDESQILPRLDRQPLLDVQLAPAVLARLRVLAAVLPSETSARMRMLVRAAVAKYEDAPDALDGLLQLLTRMGASAAISEVRGAAGLISQVSPARDVLQIIQAEDPRLTYLVLRDLPDDHPETLSILRVALIQLRAARGDPRVSAPLQSLERRFTRLGSPLP